jgi:hypothetical protein
MKKKLLFFAMCLFAFTGNVMAQNDPAAYDPAEGDIYYTVESVDVMPSKTVAITFYYNAGATQIFRGFQVEFILPDGFRRGEIDGEVGKLGAELAAHNPEMSLKTSERYDDGEDNPPTCCYMGFQMATTDMPTGEGIELFTFYVACDENVAVGEYPFTTTHCELADMKTGQSWHCTPRTMTLNVIPYAARILADDATELPEASEAPEDVIVKRTVKKGVWSTLTVPFDIPADALTEVFGEDVKVAMAKTLTENDNEQIVLTFESLGEGEGIDKNVPYLIKVGEAMEEFKVKDVMVDPDEENAYVEIDNGKTGRNRKVFAEMVGTLVAETVVPNNNLFLRDNKFFVSTGSSKLNAFRAFFDLSKYDYEYGASGANISFMVDGETTGIEGLIINGKEVVTGDVYSVNGTYMGKAENVMNKLPRGIYIVNNKKVVVK